MPVSYGEDILSSDADNVAIQLGFVGVTEGSNEELKSVLLVHI